MTRINALIATTFLTLATADTHQRVTSDINHISDNDPSAPTYGIDVSFASTGTNAISTNYAWLPHNIDPENNPSPPEYVNMPVQVLGDRNKVYNDFIKGCRDYWDKKLEEEGEGEGGIVCDKEEKDRIEHIRDQPSSMVNYTDIGYKKLKAPEHLFKMLSDFWEANKENESEETWGVGGIFVNYWDIPSTMVNVNNKTLIGGGKELKDEIWNVSVNLISEWTGQELAGSSVYGIRVYKEGAILSPHVDRLPLISSAIINVAQDVDEPWPLEVIGHDGVARNITMSPGDMILYESHSVLHGRPFALKGRYYANIFIHFMPIPSTEQLEEEALPPYIIEGSKAAAAWEDGNYDDEIPGAPKKWRKLDANVAAGEGDLESLVRIAEFEEDYLHSKDENGWQPIHEAVRSGHENVIMFLLDYDADLNAITDSGHSVLDIALIEWKGDESYIEWLESLGATTNLYHHSGEEL